jgi:hypothetical protein
LGERALGLSRDFNRDEVGFRVEVVLLGLVDDADVSVAGRHIVGQTLVDLVQFQVVASGVADAQ